MKIIEELIIIFEIFDQYKKYFQKNKTENSFLKSNIITKILIFRIALILYKYR